MSQFIKVSGAKGIMAINWALMNHCNYRCHYCHPELSDGSINTPTYDIVINFIERVIEHAKKVGLTPCFEFGGGEVTLLNYFSDIINFIHDRECYVYIVSNGSRSLTWWRKNMKYLDGVSLSYHVNDIKDGEHFINVVKLLELSNNTRLHINIMMDPVKFDECYAFAIKLKMLAKCSIALQPLYHGFGSGKITGKYNYTDKQILLMQEFRGRDDEKNLTCSRAYIDITYSDGTSGVLSTFDLLINDQINFIGWDCYSGIESMVVTFLGNIYRAWCMQDEPIGSIYDVEINIPTVPTRCVTKICQCGSDISSTKIKRNLPSYENISEVNTLS